MSENQIDTLMTELQSSPVKLWIEAWYIYPSFGVVSWRATCDSEPNTLHLKRNLWTTYHVIAGKHFTVTFMSRDAMPLQYAIGVAKMIIDGRVTRHELDLKLMEVLVRE